MNAIDVDFEMVNLTPLNSTPEVEFRAAMA